MRKSLTIRPNDPIKIQRKRDHIQIQGKCHRRSFTYFFFLLLLPLPVHPPKNGTNLILVALANLFPASPRQRPTTKPIISLLPCLSLWLTELVWDTLKCHLKPTWSTCISINTLNVPMDGISKICIGFTSNGVFTNLFMWIS